MFEKAMFLCVDAVKKILFEGARAEKQYYLRMLYYEGSGKGGDAGAAERVRAFSS